MVLPLLGSFLGSAFLPGLAAKTGLAFLANPVAAGAIALGSVVYYKGFFRRSDRNRSYFLFWR